MCSAKTAAKSHRVNLTLSTLGKFFSRRDAEIFFSGDNLHEMSNHDSLEK